jgi:hypothetical protein
MSAAGPRVLLDDDGGNAEALEPSAERDAALAAADDDAIGLHRVAERRLVRALALEPAPAIAGGCGAQIPIPRVYSIDKSPARRSC